MKVVIVNLQNVSSGKSFGLLAFTAFLAFKHFDI